MPKKKAKKAAKPETWLSSMDALGKALGVTRQTIDQWKKQFHDAPSPRQNGGHSLEQWQAFVNRHNLKGAEGPQDGQAPSFTELKMAKLKQEIRRITMENDQREGILSDPTDQIHAFGLACAAINTGFENLIKRSTPKLVGLKDQHEIEAVLREEVGILVNNLRDFNPDQSKA